MAKRLLKLVPAWLAGAIFLCFSAILCRLFGGEKNRGKQILPEASGKG